MSPTFVIELYDALASHDPLDAAAMVQRRWSIDRPTREWACYQAYAGGLPPRPLVRAALAAWNRIR